MRLPRVKREARTASGGRRAPCRDDSDCPSRSHPPPPLCLQPLSSGARRDGPTRRDRPADGEDDNVLPRPPEGRARADAIVPSTISLRRRRGGGGVTPPIRLKTGREAGPARRCVRSPPHSSLLKRQVSRESRVGKRYQLQKPKLPTQVPDLDPRIPLYKTYRLSDVTDVI